MTYVTGALIVVTALVALVRLWSRSEGLRRDRVGVVLIGAVLMTVLFCGRVVGVGADVAGALGRCQCGGCMGRPALLVLPIAVGVSMLLEPPSRHMPWLDRVWPWRPVVAAGLIIGGTVWEIADAITTSSCPRRLLVFPGRSQPSPSPPCWLQFGRVGRGFRRLWTGHRWDCVILLSAWGLLPGPRRCLRWSPGRLGRRWICAERQ